VPASRPSFSLWHMRLELPSCFCLGDYLPWKSGERFTDPSSIISGKSLSSRRVHCLVLLRFQGYSNFLLMSLLGLSRAFVSARRVPPLLGSCFWCFLLVSSLSACAFVLGLCPRSRLVPSLLACAFALGLCLCSLLVPSILGHVVMTWLLDWWLKNGECV
jgi:hypothetical protein